jgi:ADP-ribosylglycohydrolase
MNPNRQLLEWLFETGRIELQRGAAFDFSPGPMPADFDFDRVEGMMLGLAVGDALGNTTEGVMPQRRRAVYGEIRDYVPSRHSDEAVGLPSDDTQLAFWTLQQMLEDRGFEPEQVARRFSSGRIFGIGSAVREFVSNHNSKGLPWYRCGPKSAGNGALMRIAPIVIPHLAEGSSDLWVDAALCAMITHNDSASISACLSFVNMLWQLLQMDAVPNPLWWLETYVEMARELEVDEGYRPRGGAFLDYEGPLWRLVEEKVTEAYNDGLSVLDACERWYSGAYLLETVPSVIHILMKHGDDLEEAMVRAVNDTKDNDTIAAIVGSAVGALHGRKAIPDRWLSKLSGRTAESDDGMVFRLLEEAKVLWWR